MASHHPTFADEFLHGIEAVAEVVSIFRGVILVIVVAVGHIAAHTTERLRKGTAAQAVGLETEVDMIE